MSLVTKRLTDDLVDVRSSKMRKVSSFDELIVMNAANFFSQVRQSAPDSIAYLEKRRGKSDLNVAINKVTKLFSQEREDPERDVARFFERFNHLIRLLPLCKMPNLEIHIQIIANQVFTGVRVHHIHEKLFEVLPLSGTLASVFKPDIPEELSSPLIEKLTQRYNQLSLLKLFSKTAYNVPNVTFKVVTSSGNAITFFRSRTFIEPDDSDELSALFKRKLEQGHHLDLSLMRLSEWEEEADLSQLRHQIQEEYPQSLFSWAFDFYLRPDWFAKKTSSVEDFIHEFIAHFFDQDKKMVLIPSLEFDLRKILKNVHCDFFGNKKTIKSDEFEPFVHMTLIYLIEFFSEKFGSTSCSTACREHIDRGVTVMTLLFQYIRIKSGKEEDYDPLIMTMFLCPALFYANRPPHQSVMERFVRSLALFNKPGVKENLQKRQSYFSDIVIKNTF